MSDAESPTVSFAVFPFALVAVAIVVVHRTFAMLEPLEPQAFIGIVVQSIESAVAISHILSPLAVIAFAVSGSIDAFSMTLSLEIIAFVDVSVRELGRANAVGLAVI